MAKIERFDNNYTIELAMSYQSVNIVTSHFWCLEMHTYLFFEPLFKLCPKNKLSFETSLDMQCSKFYMSEVQTHD